MITIILHMKKKKRFIKHMILVVYFLKNYKYGEWCKEDEEKSKSQSEETIAERVKLIPWKR